MLVNNAEQSAQRHPARIGNRFIRLHPELWHQPAGKSLMAAWMQAWRCQPQQIKLHTARQAIKNFQMANAEQQDAFLTLLLFKPR
jgi:hypothetical protein